MAVNNEELFNSLDKAQQDIIKEAQELNLNIEPLLKHNFDWQKMNVILNGLKDNLDVSIYTTRYINRKQM